MAKILTCFVRYYSIGWLCLINWFWLGSNILAIHNMCYWPKNLYSRVQMKTSGYWMSTGNWEHLGTGGNLYSKVLLRISGNWNWVLGNLYSKVHLRISGNWNWVLGNLYSKALSGIPWYCRVPGDRLSVELLLKWCTVRDGRRQQNTRKYSEWIGITNATFFCVFLEPRVDWNIKQNIGNQGI